MNKQCLKLMLSAKIKRDLDEIFSSSAEKIDFLQNFIDEFTDALVYVNSTSDLEAECDMLDAEFKRLRPDLHD